MVECVLTEIKLSEYANMIILVWFIAGLFIVILLLLVANSYLILWRQKKYKSREIFLFYIVALIDIIANTIYMVSYAYEEPNQLEMLF